MKQLILSHPVSTLDGKRLLPEGTLLSPKIMDEFIAQSGTATYRRYPLLEYGSVKSDIRQLLSMSPYNSIFGKAGDVDDVLNFMRYIYLISPLMDVFDYFRQKDMYTYRHILNVFALFSRLHKVMVINKGVMLQEASSGPSHDFGKICVPLHILKKTTPLNRSERTIIQDQAAAGYVLLSYYVRDKKSPFAVVSRDHHERRDGSGYPRGIKQRVYIVDIIAVCDIYDALISPRPYRSSAYDNRTALEEIIEMGRRNLLSRSVIKALVTVNRIDGNYYLKSVIAKERRGEPPQDNNYGVLHNDTE